MTNLKLNAVKNYYFLMRNYSVVVQLKN